MCLLDSNTVDVVFKNTSTATSLHHEGLCWQRDSSINNTTLLKTYSRGDMLSRHNWKFDFTHLKMCYHELCLISRSIYCLHLKDFKMLSMCLDVSQIRWLAAYLNKTSLQNLVCLFYA